MSDPIEDALTLLASRVPGVEPYRWLAPGGEPCYCETQEEPPFHPGWVHSLLCTQSRNDYEAVGDCIRAIRAALSGESGEPTLDPNRELAYSFWVHYRCGYVGCTTVEPHEHGGGPPMREMTPEERSGESGEPKEPNHD